ncbi:MAG TPA: 6-phosphofructokinase [Dehalococcoidia bacterium]|nr:6-phosphofructokinase [Dehalococcoidia bacterium]
MKRIGVLTSGGDAPGMNAAIRAVVRTGIDKGWEVFGIQRGYTGLINGEVVPLGLRDVGGIIQLGGTMLGSTRSTEFVTEAGQEKALRTLENQRIEALVIIGGNGSQKGAYALSQKGFPVVGIASTIDNDLYGTEMSIGVDTALDIALVAIDRIKVTASSHRRAFAVEVMGRDTGHLALAAGIAGGAEHVVIPEEEVDMDDLAARIRNAYERGKPHAILVVAEGAKYNAEALESYFAEHQAEVGFQLRITILGYVQRGGAPGAFDRLLATRFGAAATETISSGEHGVMIGLICGRVEKIPLSEVATTKKPLDQELLSLVHVLAR